MSELVLVERHGPVALLRLNRPQALNALNRALIDALNAAVAHCDADPEIGAMVLTGSEKAFAAGADIKEMKDRHFADALVDDFIDPFTRLANARKPVIAAVSGFALGGGCEIAMMCATIFASETAKFQLPEVKLGIMPGMGGTQRLTRLVGKAKAMDMILTGRMMDATEAERCGLVARVLPPETLLDEALAAASTIAGYGRAAVLMAKASVDRALETGLAEGSAFERAGFYGLFSTEDQKEGMAAFVEKRPAAFKNR